MKTLIGKVVHYPHYDQVGSLRAITDTTGNVVKQIDYDSFGNVTYDSNASMTIPFGFAGGLRDYDVGLTRFGFRDYDPAIGRWTAKDPIDFAGGDLNLFAYVQSDPVNWIDPLGLEPPVPIDKLPPGLDFPGNIDEAERMNPCEFAWAVRPGGKWDMRSAYPDSGLSRQELTDLGNYNYGLAGAAAGFKDSTLYEAGDQDQGWLRKWKPEYGRFPSDNPRDIYWISIGINDYRTGYWKK